MAEARALLKKIGVLNSFDPYFSGFLYFGLSFFDIKAISVDGKSLFHITVNPMVWRYREFFFPYIWLLFCNQGFLPYIYIYIYMAVSRLFNNLGTVMRWRWSFLSKNLFFNQKTITKSKNN